MNDTEISKMKSEMQDVLQKNILRFWLDKMIDHENGGFYGRMDGQGILHPEAEKGAIEAGNEVELITLKDKISNFVGDA